MPFEQYLKDYWKKSNPSCYLHQWQFPVESKIARKHIGAKHVYAKNNNGSNNDENKGFRRKSHLPSCMGIDLLSIGALI